MGFFTSTGSFLEDGVYTGAADHVYATQGVENVFRHLFAFTVCPDDVTLTPRTSGTFNEPAPFIGTGPIAPFTLLDTQSVGGYTVQAWERSGVDDFASDPVYYVWDLSRALTSSLDDYVFLQTHSFNGSVAFYWALDTFTGGPPQTFPTVPELTGPGWDFDVASSAYVDQDTGSGSQPDVADPLLDNGTSGRFPGGLSDVTGSIGFAENPDTPVSGYTIDEPGASWNHGALALFVGVDVRPTSTGWRIGGPKAGSSPW